MSGGRELERIETDHSNADTQPTRVDLVIPVFNEIDCLGELVRRLGALRTSEAAALLDIRAIIVDDGSTDGSGARIDALAVENPWIHALHLVRNFGHQPAVTAGLDASDADYVAVIDADLQDPPELIPAMLDQLRIDCVYVVYGTRSARPGDSWFKRKTAVGFYRLMRKLSGLDLPIDAGDFRVMDRAVVDALRELPEHHRMMRALIPWLGYSSSGFRYERDQRFVGATKYPLRKMLVLASHAVFSFSTFPIRLVQGAGLLLAALGSLALATLAVLDLAGVVTVRLAAWIGIGMVMQTAVLLLAIGLVGGYVYRIQDEVKGRPLYVLQNTRVGHRQPTTTPVESQARVDVI